MLDRRLIRNFDLSLFLIMLLIAIIGVALVYSAVHGTKASKYAGAHWRQVIWINLGLLAFLLLLAIDYRTLSRYAYLLYLFNLVLLMIVLLQPSRGGAHRWIEMGPLSIQPSEFTKLVLILTLSRYLTDRGESIKRLLGLIPAVILTILPIVLIVKEPDLGTALLLIPILFVMLYVAGASPKHLLIFLGIGILLSPLLFFFLRDYQKVRLLVYIQPSIEPLGAAYSVNQSKIAIGSGGPWGKGWLCGPQTQLAYLPAQYTDFIFSCLGEEWGFFGCSVLLALFFIMIRRGFQTALSVKDRLGILLVTGMTVLILLQVVINVGMCMGMVPVVGLTLPLVSYGGSSVVATMLAISLIINVGMRRFMF